MSNVIVLVVLLPQLIKQKVSNVESAILILI